MSLLLCVDIDGTLADATTRFAKAGAEPGREDEAAYSKWVETVNEGLEHDKPVSGMASLIAIVGAMGLADVLYVTGRSESLRTQTEKWLGEHKFPIMPLCMRPENDWSENAEYKQRVINKAKYTYKASEVILIDDDQQGKLETMCKINGYTLLKAVSGGKE